MAKTVYSKAELDEMMAEASAAVEILVKNEVAAFQKNVNCAPGAAPAMKSDSVQTAEDKKAQGGQMTKAGEDPASPPPDASASAPAPDAPAPAPDASASAPAPAPDASASAPAGDPAAAAGAPSPEELKSAYDQLSPDEKKMHLAALQASMAMDQSAGAPPASPSAPPAAPAPGPDATAPMPADQSQGVNPEFAMKSEQMEKEIEGLKKNLSLAVEALTLVVSQPKVKSITAEDVVLKNEPAVQLQGLTKSQITERLNKAIRGGKLEKSDGELIKGFYNGQKQVADIAHLLK